MHTVGRPALRDVRTSSLALPGIAATLCPGAPFFGLGYRETTATRIELAVVVSPIKPSINVKSVNQRFIMRV